jgi:hypothetical protein
MDSDGGPGAGGGVMSAWKRNPLRNRPILGGLLWAVLFVPTFLLLMWITGEPIHDLRGVLILCARAPPGGLVWGLIMRVFVAAQRGRDQ